MMKGRMGGLAYRGGSLAFGEFGLQTLDPAWLTAQIEGARRDHHAPSSARRRDPGVPGQADL
jgi:ribosomal protein L16/L10AE